MEADKSPQKSPISLPAGRLWGRGNSRLGGGWESRSSCPFIPLQSSMVSLEPSFLVLTLPLAFNICLIILLMNWYTCTSLRSIQCWKPSLH